MEVSIAKGFLCPLNKEFFDISGYHHIHTIKFTIPQTFTPETLISTIFNHIPKKTPYKNISITIKCCKNCEKHNTYITPLSIKSLRLNQPLNISVLKIFVLQ